jgi:hypothetical protein
VCLVSCGELAIDTDRKLFRVGNHQVDEGAVITVDGDHGCIYEGRLEMRTEVPIQLIGRIHSGRDTWSA